MKETQLFNKVIFYKIVSLVTNNDVQEALGAVLSRRNNTIY